MYYDYGNLCTQEVEQLEVYSDFFELLNMIDHHNWQSLQSNLAQEKE